MILHLNSRCSLNGLLSFILNVLVFHDFLFLWLQETAWNAHLPQAQLHGFTSISRLHFRVGEVKVSLVCSYENTYCDCYLFQDTLEEKAVGTCSITKSTRYIPSHCLPQSYCGWKTEIYIVCNCLCGMVMS